MKSDTNSIMVSVICTAYNHEKYIGKCLESLVRQKADFAYEILVNDDASIDQTTEIVRSYAEQYPDLIVPIFQAENQYSKHINISRDILLPLARGKYIAFCEGDDWWCDDHKLQKQVDALEAHPECMLCVHNVSQCYENGEPTGLNIPLSAEQPGLLSSESVISRVMEFNFFHLTSYMIRGDYYRQILTDLPTFWKISPVGDFPTLLYLANAGDVYCVDGVLTCYRAGSINSWTQRVLKKSVAVEVEHRKQMIRVIQEFDVYSNYRFHDLCERGVWIARMIIAKLSCSKESYRDVLRTPYAKKTPLWKKRNTIMHAYCPGLLAMYHKIRQKHALISEDI